MPRTTLRYQRSFFQPGQYGLFFFGERRLEEHAIQRIGGAVEEGLKHLLFAFAQRPRKGPQLQLQSRDCLFGDHASPIQKSTYWPYQPNTWAHGPIWPHWGGI